jgi:hypothetical protein
MRRSMTGLVVVLMSLCSSVLKLRDKDRFKLNEMVVREKTKRITRFYEIWRGWRADMGGFDHRAPISVLTSSNTK